MISKMRSLVRRIMNGAKMNQVLACLGESFWRWRAKLGVVPFAVVRLRQVIVDGWLWRRRMTGGPCLWRDGLNVQPPDSSRNLDGA